MVAKRGFSLVIASIVGLAALFLVDCGNGGGGGGASSTVGGNVSDAPSAAVQPAQRTWFAWVNEAVSFARRAYAAVSLSGIGVRASANGRQSSSTTDDSGDFVIGSAPTGDVTVTFERGNCTASVQLPDIPADATLDLQDVDFSSCNDAQPAKIAETFSGVIRNVPSSSNGNLNVCVNSGGEHRVRVVKLQDATFKDANGDDASFEDLEEGQFIEAVGEREGQGLPSALDADTVQILGAGNASTCSGIPTETPTQTPTVTTTPEPTATPTPTPT